MVLWRQEFITIPVHGLEEDAYPQIKVKWKASDPHATYFPFSSKSCFMGAGLRDVPHRPLPGSDPFDDGRSLENHHHGPLLAQQIGNSLLEGRFIFDDLGPRGRIQQ